MPAPGHPMGEPMKETQCCGNCYQWTGRNSFLARLFGFRTLRTGRCLSACSDKRGKTLWWYVTCAWHFPVKN